MGDLRILQKGLERQSRPDLTFPEFGRITRHFLSAYLSEEPVDKDNDFFHLFLSLL